MIIFDEGQQLVQFRKIILLNRNEIVNIICTVAVQFV